MIGSDDVLACFIAGNVFTWDDWFRLETMDDSFQPTLDMLLNVTIFIWFGAVCPWKLFFHNPIISPTRLVFLGILVLLLRRPPIVFAMHKHIHQIDEKRQALYVGFFGPIGVSAIFYLYVSIDFLKHIKIDGEVRSDAKFLIEVVHIVVWFLCICSVVIHGISIPLGKLGFYIPRTISNALSEDRNISQSFHVRRESIEPELGMRTPSKNDGSHSVEKPNPRLAGRIGRAIIRPKSPSPIPGHPSSNTHDPNPNLDLPTMPGEASQTVPTSDLAPPDMAETPPVSLPIKHSSEIQRSIRFPDEPHLATAS